MTIEQRFICGYCPARFSTEWEREVHEKECVHTYIGEPLSSNPKLHCKGCEAWDRIEQQYSELSGKYHDQRDEIERLTAELAKVDEHNSAKAQVLHEAYQAGLLDSNPYLKKRAHTLLGGRLPDETTVCRYCGKPADSEGSFQCRCTGSEPLNCPICHQWPGHHFDWCTKAGDDEC